ncbi:hypothetical protein KEM55_005420 [Ascosphaera atra]|nr:hypothetical protein KEM55_005420 [Ascosphaera atra]
MFSVSLSKISGSNGSERLESGVSIGVIVRKTGFRLHHDNNAAKTWWLIQTISIQRDEKSGWPVTGRSALDMGLMCAAASARRKAGGHRGNQEG